MRSGRSGAAGRPPRALDISPRPRPLTWTTLTRTQARPPSSQVSGHAEGSCGRDAPERFAGATSCGKGIETRALCPLTRRFDRVTWVFTDFPPNRSSATRARLVSEPPRLANFGHVLPDTFLRGSLAWEGSGFDLLPNLPEQAPPFPPAFSCRRSGGSPAQQSSWRRSVEGPGSSYPRAPRQLPPGTLTGRGRCLEGSRFPIAGAPLSKLDHPKGPDHARP